MVERPDRERVAAELREAYRKGAKAMRKSTLEQFALAKKFGCNVYELIESQPFPRQPEHETEKAVQRFAAADAVPAAPVGGDAARFRTAAAKINHEVCQSLGKALGYPWYKDDQKNFPGATEADGICEGEMVAEAMADQAANRIRELEALSAQAVPEGWIDVVGDLLTAAKMLQANSVGCAQNHYGEDFSVQGLPGWLADTQANIDKAETMLAAAPSTEPGGG